MAKPARLTVLGDEEIRSIHEASLTVLHEVGVHVPHDDMLKRFIDNGAKSDMESRTVRIPPELVEKCLRSAGKRFVLAGRDVRHEARFGYGERNYNSIAGEAYWLDDRTGKRRFPVIADVETAARIGDALPRINIVGAMADPQDVPVQSRCVEVAAALFRNTTKPITFWFNDRASAEFVIELFLALRGNADALAEKPPGYPFLEPISPLGFSFHGIDLLYETCKIPLPVPIGPMAQVGTTGPATRAGTLVQENAEILAGVCVTQLIREGTPVCYGGIPHAFDMGTTQMIFSGPEQALMAVAMTQLGKSYGLPVYINVGLTDSKIPDAQAGLEAAATLAYGMAAGADIFGHMGICGVDQAASPAMLLLQHEIIDYLEHVMAGFDVSPETLALDVIRSVGPRGNYIETEHTLKHFRKEVWFPKLLDRNFFEHWADRGRFRMSDRITHMLDEILHTHEPEPPGAEQAKEIKRVVASARKHLVNQADTRQS